MPVSPGNLLELAPAEQSAAEKAGIIFWTAEPKTAAPQTAPASLESGFFPVCRRNCLRTA